MSSVSNANSSHVERQEIWGLQIFGHFFLRIEITMNFGGQKLVGNHSQCLDYSKITPLKNYSVLPTLALKPKDMLWQEWRISWLEIRVQTSYWISNTYTHLLMGSWLVMDASTLQFLVNARTCCNNNHPQQLLKLEQEYVIHQWLLFFREF